MKKIIWTLSFLFCLCEASAQVKTLSLNEYLSLVARTHPIALKAGLNTDKARYNARQALGGFDPKLNLIQGQKVFDGKTYYDYLIPEIKLPLWYGVDIKGSYTYYKGDYVNPENKVPKEGLGYLGIDIPLGKGLFIDERRAAIKQATVFSKMAENYKTLTLNDLFLEATDAYLDWIKAWLNTTIYQRATVLATERLRGTKSLVLNGDRPAIDTLEAEVLLQNRVQKLTDYQTLQLNAKNNLVSFLWLNDASPIKPEEFEAIPDEALLATTLPDSLSVLLPSAVAADNPEVKNYGLKIDELQIERKLKLEALKPTLNFQLGLLNTGKNIFLNMEREWLQNNNKIGFNFSMPLTFTKERASYSLAKIKIREAEYVLADKRNLVATKWQNYKNSLQNINVQLAAYKTILLSTQELLKGEEVKFKFGESSLFLVNAREQKLLEVQEKLNEISTKRVTIIQQLKFIANAISF